MSKKRSSEIFGVKIEIFSGKSVIQVREKIFRPPKLGARSPPMHPVQASEALSPSKPQTNVQYGAP